MRRSAPLTTFTISYGGVQLTDDPAALTPVFIGPTGNSGGLIFTSTVVGNFTPFVSSGTTIANIDSTSNIAVVYNGTLVVSGATVSSGATFIVSSGAVTSTSSKLSVAGGTIYAADHTSIGSGADCVVSGGSFTSKGAAVAGCSWTYASGCYQLYAGSAVTSDMLGLTEDNLSGNGTEDGAWTATNPLGMAYYAATQTGATNFYIMATPDDTNTAIGSAMSKALKSESVYALVPMVQNAAILTDAVKLVESYSAPTKAQMKRLWVFATPVDSTDGTTVAETVVAGQIYNNSRVSYVYNQSCTVGGIPCSGAQFVVPVLATMRATMAPHAPLTDLPIPGVSIFDTIQFSDDDYALMNNAGVWVCFKDGRGENVTRHAITTGGAGTIAEEDSAVSNGDNIVRTVRDQVSWLRGNCNVTPALIDKIYANVQNAFNRILARNYSDLIGPQILEVNSVVVKQDPNNTAGVIGTFDLDLPDVYLRGDFTFNLF